MKREVLYALIIIFLMILSSLLLVLISWFLTSNPLLLTKTNERNMLLDYTVQEIMILLWKDVYKMFMFIMKPLFVLLVICYHSSSVSGNSLLYMYCICLFVFVCTVCI